MRVKGHQILENGAALTFQVDLIGSFAIFRDGAQFDLRNKKAQALLV
ncbi:MAG: hypothetical protein O3A08_14955 [Proteobacteria bacterium]|jgi:hypothetical protein|nr:hypothetical protein [Pseudomonadota bacterium]